MSLRYCLSGQGGNAGSFTSAPEVDVLGAFFFVFFAGSGPLVEPFGMAVSSRAPGAAACSNCCLLVWLSPAQYACALSQPAFDGGSESSLSFLANGLGLPDLATGAILVGLTDGSLPAMAVFGLAAGLSTMALIDPNPSPSRSSGSSAASL